MDCAVPPDPIWVELGVIENQRILSEKHKYPILCNIEPILLYCSENDLFEFLHFAEQWVNSLGQGPTSHRAQKEIYWALFENS